MFAFIFFEDGLIEQVEYDRKEKDIIYFKEYICSRRCSFIKVEIWNENEKVGEIETEWYMRKEDTINITCNAFP